MMLQKISCLLLLCCFTSSCATLFTGTRDPILFTTQPAGATVWIDGYAAGQTPILLDVRRTLGERWVQLELEGYEPEIFRLNTTFNGVAVANLTCLVCWAVDLASGAASKFEDTGFATKLTPTIESTEQLRQP